MQLAGMFDEIRKRQESQLVRRCMLQGTFTLRSFPIDLASRALLPPSGFLQPKRRKCVDHVGARIARMPGKEALRSLLKSISGVALRHDARRCQARTGDRRVHRFGSVEASRLRGRRWLMCSKRRFAGPKAVPEGGRRVTTTFRGTSAVSSSVLPKSLRRFCASARSPAAHRAP